MKKPLPESNQSFAIVYDHREGNKIVCHYQVCFSRTPGTKAAPTPWTRVTTITAVTTKAETDFRVVRVKDPALWDLIRSAVVDGDTHLVTPRKGVAAR